MMAFSVTSLAIPTVAYAQSQNGCAILQGVNCDNTADGTQIVNLLRIALQILTAGVGIVAIGALVWAGILYASASDDSGRVNQAKTIIYDTVIGIVAYGLMVVVLQFLIPGGVFG